MTEESSEVRDLAAIPKDMALLKMQNDSIMAMAASHPRNMGQIKNEMVEQLQAFPVFAQAAVYSKPVGDGKMVRGLSVRAAEALFEAYGHCSVDASAEPEGDDGARVTAIFVDFQKGRIWRDSGYVSKFYKKRGGGTAKHPEDRFWNVVVKAESSRRIREVILRSVPPGMKMELQSIAEREMAKSLTDSEVQRIIAEFEKLNVNLAMLETLLGKTLDAGWNQDDRVTLKGAYTALKDGESSIGEMFSNKPEDADQSGSLNDKLKADAETEKAKRKKATDKKKADKSKADKKAAAEQAIKEGEAAAAAEQSESKPAEPDAKQAEPEAEQPAAESKPEEVEDPNPPKQPETPADKYPDADEKQLKFFGFQVDRIMAAKSSKVLANIRKPLDKAMEDGKLTGNQYTDLLNEIEEAHQQFAT